MMKKYICLFLGLFFLVSLINCQESKMGLTHDSPIQNCRLESIKGSNPIFSGKKRKEFNSYWPGGLNRGVALNFTGLGCIDNYPSLGIGAELAATHITNFGITSNGYIGGASNQSLWVGFSAGYTHGLTKIAPYGLLGGAFLLSGLDAALAGTLELGVNFRLTGWLSAKPSIRLSIGKFEGETSIYSNNVMMVSLTLDPFRLLPYYY